MFLKKNGKKHKHITIETPCRVNELEGLLHVVSEDGHWHDCAIIAQDGKIVIEYEDD